MCTQAAGETYKAGDAPPRFARLRIAPTGFKP
jgi:hypothetical protein